MRRTRVKVAARRRSRRAVRTPTVSPPSAMSSTTKAKVSGNASATLSKCSRSFALPSNAPDRAGCRCQSSEKHAQAASMSRLFRGRRNSTARLAAAPAGTWSLLKSYVFAYGVRGVLEMRVSVRDGGVTSAAAVARMMLHVWVCRIVLTTHAFDKQSLRRRSMRLQLQLLKPEFATASCSARD